MDPQRWKEVQSVFREMIPLDYDTRLNRLKTIEQKDPELYKEVKSLLKADTERSSLLDGTVSDAINISDIFEYEGEQVGPFRIVRKIGSGGMGNVYLGERNEGGFEQQVALKFIRKGMDSTHIITRFKEERKILARLQHPNIARLVDGGLTEDGQPWFAMEYAEGVPVDEFCKQEELSIRERLQLFSKVCEAVQYAHRNLIVHRDLKPDNVLVTGHAGDYQVKLLDFGIAQIIDEDDAKDSSQGILTRAYAAPEQLDEKETTTLSDIYSLGVMLHEILTGAHPDPKYRIGEVTQHAADPELLTICQKAMAEDPEDRYLTASDMNNDLDNYNNAKPVSSYSGNRFYVFRKFMRRNRNTVSMGAVSVLAILFLILIYTEQLRQEKTIAEEEAARSARISSVLTSSLRSLDPTATPLSQLSARRFLDNSLSYIGAELQDDPDMQSQLYNTMGEIYSSLGVFNVADSLAEMSYQYYLSKGDTLDSDYIESVLLRTDVMMNNGDFDEAEALILKAVNSADQVMDRKSVEYADIYYTYNNILYQKGDYLKADSVLHVITPIYLEKLGREHSYYQDMMFYLGTNYRKLEMFDSAEVYLKKALDLSREFNESPNEMIASNLNHMSSLYQNMGDYESALPYALESYEQRKLIFGEDHINTVASIANTARTYGNLERYPEAAEYYEKAVSILSSLYGEDNYNLSGLTQSLGNIYLKMGDTEKALENMRFSLMVGQKNLPEGDRRLAYSYHGYAVALLEAGDNEQALKQVDTAVQIRESTLPEDNILTTNSRMVKLRCLLKLDRREEAEELILQIRTYYEKDPERFSEELDQLNELTG